MAGSNRGRRHSGVSRRGFIAGAAAGVLAPGVLSAQERPAAAPPPRKLAPSDAVNVAVVGAGGRGFEDLRGLEGTGVNVVALCDCDLPHAAESFKKYPRAKQYQDWRKMFDAQKDI